MARGGKKKAVVAARLREARTATGLSRRELGLRAGLDPSVASPRIKTVKRLANPEFKPDEQRGYRFNCWLPNDATGFLHPKGRTKGWTTESWDIINYYLAKGIGLGFKALSVPKAEHIWVFDEASVNAVIEEVKRRWVTLRLEK